MVRVAALSVLLLVLLAAAGDAEPVFYQKGLLDFLQPATQRPYQQRQYIPGRQPQQQGQRKGRSRYDQLCRVHNPNPFAFPGNSPYPAQPLCSYGR